MENKAKYTVVGLFVLIFTISTIIFILWLARYDIKEINAKEYRLYSKTSIAGLNKNSMVEYKGLDIGTVDNIRIDPNNLEQIEIILKITNPSVIKIDSYAIVQSQGVTGNKIIEIEGGTQNSLQLTSKDSSYSIIPLKQSFINKLTSSAGNISSQIETVLQKFEILLNDKNIQNIEQILLNTNSSSKNINQTMLKVNNLIEKELVKTLKNINSMTNSIDSVMKKDITNTIKKIDSLSKNFTTLSKDIQIIVNNDVKALIKELRKTTKSSQNIDKVLSDLENTLEKIDTTVDEFNSNGGDMIFKTRAVKYGPGEKE